MRPTPRSLLRHPAVRQPQNACRRMLLGLRQRAHLQRRQLVGWQARRAAPLLPSMLLLLARPLQEARRALRAIAAMRFLTTTVAAAPTAAAATDFVMVPPLAGSTVVAP